MIKKVSHDVPILGKNQKQLDYFLKLWATMNSSKN